MTDIIEPESCSGCGTSNVELESFNEVIDGLQHYCPYCMVALKLRDSQTKNLSNMFNLLEKRLKDHIDKNR